MFRARYPRFAAPIGLLLLAGCQGGPTSTNPNQPPPSTGPSLTLVPTSINISAGDPAVTFSALVQNSSETVTWTLSGPGSVTPLSGPNTLYTPPESVGSAQGASLTATFGTTGATATAPIAIYPESVTPPAEPPPAPPPTDPPTNPPPPTDPDTTPPTVTSIEPANDATGVANDANIVITFSERMDQVATQEAYTSADLPAGAVSFTWNEAGTVLTVTPNSPLEYASGEERPAKRYSFAVTGAARDVAGNALVPVLSGFTTLKRIEVALVSQAARDGYVFSRPGVVDAGFPIIRVGDWLTNEGVRGFLSFDLAGVPEGVGGEALEEAKLYVYKEEVRGSPYVSLGFIVLEHVNYGPSLDEGDYRAPRLADLGAFDGPGSPSRESPYREADVLSAVRDDLLRRSERGSRSQYRLSFPVETDNDGENDLVVFSSGEATNKPELRLTYLVP